MIPVLQISQFKDAFQNAYGGGIQDAFVTVFDPAGCSLVYSSYLGGNGEDGGTGMAVDARGDAYVTGFVFSTNFPTHHAFQQKLMSSQGNAFVTKISAH